MTTGNGNYTVTIRAVDDVQAFLSNMQAHVNGSIGVNASEVDIGVILSQLTAVNKNDTLIVNVNGASTAFKVAGIIQTSQQSDTELVMPLATLQALTHENSTVSLIEFSLKDTDSSTTALNNTLPNDVKLTNIHQVANFAQDVNNETVNFINVWSIAIFFVVIAASYVMATRLVSEAKEELYILRTLGLKKKATFSLIVVHSLTIAFVGSAIGVAIGIVGTQLAATVVRWVWGNLQLAPFLQPQQALQAFC